MTNQEIALVQRSWKRVHPDQEAIAEMFYRKVFELDPSMRALFPGDLKQQGTRLMQMVGATVRGLDRLDALLPVIRELGMRHAACGVEDRHYGTVATALLQTLEHALQEDFTQPVKSAWIKT